MRPWIHLQLSTANDSAIAAESVKAWKKERHAAYHVVRAILLYRRLLAGDLSAIADYFPLLSLSTNAARLPVAPIKPAQIRVEARSAEQDIADALGAVGLDSLEF